MVWLLKAILAIHIETKLLFLKILKKLVLIPNEDCAPFVFFSSYSVTSEGLTIIRNITMETKGNNALARNSWRKSQNTIRMLAT